MRAKRLFRHLFTTRIQLKQAFSRSTLHDIEAAIQSSERQHSGELRFVVEASLDPLLIMEGETPRMRAIDLFSSLRIWDTEHNCGLLIYVLIADHAVEIVADRGIHAKVGDVEWTRICHEMETAFRHKHYRDGVLTGIKQVTGHLIRHFPMRDNDKNELSDRPVVLS